MGIPKTFRYQDQGLICECGRSFKTPQALKAHQRMGTCAARPSTTISREPTEEPPPVTIGPPSASNKQLREELEKRRLLGELGKYGQAPQPTPPALDVAQQFQAEAEAIDKLGAGSQPQMSPLQQMAQEAIALDAIRGKTQGGNSNWLELLKGAAAFLGIDGAAVRDFIFKQREALPTNPNSFKIGDTEIPAGAVQLDSNFVQFLIQREDAKAAAEASKNRDMLFVEGAKSIGRAAEAAGLLDKLGGAVGGVTGQPAQPKREAKGPGGAVEMVQEDVTFPVWCPACGMQDSVTVAADSLNKAREFLFTCAQCNFTDAWVYEPQKGAEPYIGPLNPELVVDVECPSCKSRGVSTHLVASSLTPPGTVISCREPRCDYSFTLEEKEEIAEGKKSSRGRGSRLKELRQDVEEKRLEVELQSLESEKTPDKKDEGVKLT